MNSVKARGFLSCRLFIWASSQHSCLRQSDYLHSRPGSQARVTKEPGGHTACLFRSSLRTQITLVSSPCHFMEQEYSLLSLYRGRLKFHDEKNMRGVTVLKSKICQKCHFILPTGMSSPMSAITLVLNK